MSNPTSPPSLARSVREGLVVGCAVSGELAEKYSATEQAALLRHFSGLTPENCMKPGPIHPEPSGYAFQEADALLDFATRHDLEVAGHTLCWHQQTPPWFFVADSDGTPLQKLQRHINTVLEHTEGKLRGWDVVNEAVADFGEYLRDTAWLRAAGPGYVAEAFRFAQQADASVELYYNDYNLEKPDKRDRALRLLRELLDDGIRIDGVGIQGHWLSGQVPFSDIEAAIEAYAALGLSVMFTEVDLDVIDRPDCNADLDTQKAYDPGEDRYVDGCPDEVLAQQAKEYAQLFRLCNDSAHVSRLTLWGLSDGRSWLNHWPGARTNHPLLFDRQCRPKPALSAILAAFQAAD